MMIRPYTSSLDSGCFGVSTPLLVRTKAESVHLSMEKMDPTRDRNVGSLAMVVILCCVGAPPYEDGAEVVGA